MIADLMRRMTDAGAPMEAIMIAVEAIEAMQRADQDRREKRAAQKRKERGGDVARLSRDKEATVAPTSRDKEDPHTPKENPPLPSPPKGGSVRPPAGGLDDPKSILAEVLPIATAAEVVAHRKALKSPLTAGSARGLARNFAAFGDPVAAAQAMMAGGWRGFKPEWMADGRQARAGPAQQARGRSVPELAAMNLDDPDIFDDHQRTDPRHGAAESADRPDETRSGFAGRLSEPAAHAARRGALIDH